MIEILISIILTTCEQIYEKMILDQENVFFKISKRFKKNSEVSILMIDNAI